MPLFSGRRGSFAAAIGLLAACGPGAAYDNLSSGGPADASVANMPPLVDDGSLPPPRPIAPLSVSIVATRRPRFRWSLADRLTGAIVEVARTRAFDAATTRRFDAPAAAELVVPEDLDPGLWFWRLRGRTDRQRSTVTSAIWEVLVRGPAPGGSSDVPTGGVVDHDGDGEADLVIGGEVEQSPLVSMIAFLRGLPGGQLAVEPSDKTPMSDSKWLPMTGKFGTCPPEPQSCFYSEGQLTIAAGDVDGDGVLDIISAGVVGIVLEDRAIHAVPTLRWGGDRSGVERGLFPSARSGVPGLAAAGDIDGDGYGDLLIGASTGGYAVFGSARRTDGPAMVPLADPDRETAGRRVVVGAFDANRDGRADLAFAVPTIAGPLLRVFPGGADRVLTNVQTVATEAPPTALAAADYDGDAVSDVAGIAGGAVCFWTEHAASLLGGGRCSEPVVGETPRTLTSVDVDEDGRDDVVAVVETGAGEMHLRVFRLTGAGAVTSSAIADPPAAISERITTVWPGRPGPGRWAVIASDRASVLLFEGTTLRQTVGRSLLTPFTYRGIR
jgi:hypothetical protein